MAAPLSAMPRRPAWVWVASLYLLTVSVLSALSYVWILQEIHRLPAELQSFFSSAATRVVTFVNISLTLWGAVALFMLRRQAFYLLLASSVLDTAATLHAMLVGHSLTWMGRVELIAMAVGFLASTAINVYAWVLLRRGILNDPKRAQRPFSTYTSPRAPWVRTLIRIVPVALGSGVVWQVMDCRMKSQSAMLDALRTANELYARQQQINAEVSPLLPDYILQRDVQIQAETDDNLVRPESAEVARFKRRIEFKSLLGRLTTLVIQYNHVEFRLATLERRAPRWFPLPIPPGPATILNATPDSTGHWVKIVFRNPPLDELEVAVEKDIAALIGGHRN
jgi:hypothetical protein